MPEEYAIDLRGIRKTFGSVIANDSVDLKVKNGEILSLLGENGSGKTTLMNMISGIYRPDAGSIFVRGKEVEIHSPRDSQALGIGMIHQHFKLVDVMSAKENIVLGPKPEKRITDAQLTNEINSLCDRFGLEIDPDKLVHNMSVSEKQTVEILKVMYRKCDILILDEPTAVLTPHEIEKLFAILRRMKEQNCAVIIITHKLNEVMEISDRVAILRKGKSVGDFITAETNTQQLTDAMVGHKVNLSIERPECERGDVKLDVRELTVRNEDNLVALDKVSFSLYGGEILGVAGIAGSGQRELCETITGLHSMEGGAFALKGEDVTGNSARELAEKGIMLAFVPEDRLGMGLVGSMSIADNVMLKSYNQTKGMFADRRGARTHSRTLIDKLQISTPSYNHPVKQLSGGNIQKVLLGREIDLKPEVLVAAYPVRGLDINSSYVVYSLLNEQKKQGAGVLFIGEDLDVLLELSDRILVLCGGKVAGIVDGRTATKEQLGNLMTGIKADAGDAVRKEAAGNA